MHRLLLAADIAPGNGFDTGQYPVQSFGSADHFDGDALVGIEPQIQTCFELFFHQQRGANHHQIRYAGFIAHPNAAIGKQFDHFDHGSVLVEAE